MNEPWKYLWSYVHLLEDEPENNGLRPEPSDEDGILEDENGTPEGENEVEEEDSDEDDIGDFPFEEDEDEEEDNETPVGEPDESPEFGITPPENPIRFIAGFTKSGNDYIREFDSWWDFATSASDMSLRGWNERNCASQKIDRESWTGTKSFADAVDMGLRSGWPEGRKLLNESLIAVRPRPKVYDSLEFEVAGAVPCVPVYCAGDPAWMISDPGAVMRSAKPIVRIDYNHWVHAGVDINSMMLRGAAIVSLADSLERQSFSTELRIIGNSSSGFMGGSGKNFRYSIVYKRAGEPLDLDRAAFAIAHPSSMRRLAFAILEQHRELERDFQGSYGMPMYTANPSPTTNLDSMTVLFVPGPRGHETPESANQAVAKAAEKLLNQLQKEAADD